MTDDAHVNLRAINASLAGTKVVNAALTLEKQVNIFESRLEGSISIGAYSYANPGCDIRHAVIGKYCSIGDGVYISPNRHPYTWLSTHPIVLSKSSSPYNDHVDRVVNIGSDVWIGGRSTIMAGITIGNGAVIGAGSIVTKDVAPFTVVAGIPAKFIRNRFTNEVTNKIESLRWWEYDLDLLNINIDYSSPNVSIDVIKSSIESGLLKKFDDINILISIHGEQQF